MQKLIHHNNVNNTALFVEFVDDVESSTCINYNKQTIQLDDLNGKNKLCQPLNRIRQLYTHNER